MFINQKLTILLLVVERNLINHKFLNKFILNTHTYTFILCIFNIIVCEFNSDSFYIL
jgi:hypothetical protein